MQKKHRQGIPLPAADASLPAPDGGQGYASYGVSAPKPANISNYVNFRFEVG